MEAPDHANTRGEDDQPRLQQGAIGTLILAAVTTAFMVQATRVFLSYMVFIIDQSERVQLGGTAGAVYVAIALGALIPRLAGFRNSLVWVTTVMVAMRLLLQVWDLPEARMWLGAATIMSAGWLLPLLLAHARSAAALGFGVGLALDFAFRIARGSLDIAFIPGIGAHLVALGLALLAGFAVALMLRGGRSVATGGHALGAFVVGPALALHHLTFGNPGAIQLQLGVTMQAAAWLASAGILLGLATALLPKRNAGRSLRIWIVACALLGALALLAFWDNAFGLGSVGLVIGTASTVALVIFALEGKAGASGVTATALWLTVGLLLQAVVLFAYFSATGWPVLIVALYAIVVLPALPPAITRQAAPIDERVARGGISAAAMVLLAACLLLTAKAASPGTGAPLSDEITVMTYNIQSGFSRDNDWDLEATARVIEAADPDVVILQEVGRGWPILTGIDQAGWLSIRLDMQLVWGPASQDDQWGNAILTKAPIVSSDWIKFSTTENLRRGAVLAELETGSGTISIIGTHLDNPGDAAQAREEQVGQLLEFRGEAAPAILAGDLNADPGTDPIVAIERAGFVDTGQELGEDVFTSEDARRIDYIFVTDGFELLSIDVPDVWASDHLPVVVTLRIAP